MNIWNIIVVLEIQKILTLSLNEVGRTFSPKVKRPCTESAGSFSQFDLIVIPFLN